MPARPDAPLRRRRAWARAGVVVGLALLGALDHAGLLVAAPSDAPRLDGRAASLVEVLDWRTVEVALAPAGAGGEERMTLRLLGLTPYASAPEAARFGPQAMEALRAALVEGATLSIEPDLRRARWRAPTGRLVTSGGDDVAAELIRRGLARAQAGAAHSAARAHQKAQISARRAGAGLWAVGP